jgi:hypothetical protein
MWMTAGRFLWRVLSGINQPDLSPCPNGGLRRENFHRLAKEYEYRVSTSEAMIQLTFIALMLNKI